MWYFCNIKKYGVINYGTIVLQNHPKHTKTKTKSTTTKNLINKNKFMFLNSKEDDIISDDPGKLYAHSSTLINNELYYRKYIISYAFLNLIHNLSISVPTDVE